MKKFVINMLVALTATFAIGSIATPAAAQSTSCVGSACSDGSGTVIDVSAGAGHAGDFRAMWDAGEGGTGSASAVKEGGAYATFDITYDSCNTGDCGAARVTAEVGGYEIGQSMATANAPNAGQWAVAQNTGIAQAAGRLQVSIRREPPATDTTHTPDGQ